MPQIIAHVCASLGWTWDYAEAELDIPRLAALTEYWDRCPPVHLLVRDFVGYKPSGKNSEPVNSPQEVESLFGIFGRG